MSKVDYDAGAAEYAQHRRVHPRGLQDLVVTVQPGASSAVLEVGSGNGNYLHANSQISGCGCWGIDPSEAMLAVARERLPRAMLRQDQAESLAGLPDGLFDLGAQPRLITPRHQSLLDQGRVQGLLLLPGQPQFGRIGWVVRNAHFPVIHTARQP